MMMNFFPLQIFLLLFVCISLYLLIHLVLRPFKPRPSAGASSSIGGFKRHPLLGSVPDFLANRHRFLEWITEVLSSLPSNTSVIFLPGKNHGIITACPSVVERILKSNFPNYPKGARVIPLLSDFLGAGIFNADGDLWRLQRKTASYEFSKRSLRNFVLDTVRSEIQTRLIPLLRDHAKTGRVFDLQDVLERFAFDNVCKIAFNVDPGCLGLDGESGSVVGEYEFMRAFEEAAVLSLDRFMYAFPFVWRIMKYLNVGSEKKLRESIKIVHEFADKIIQKRLEEADGNDYEDLLSRFIGTEVSSPVFLRDVVISFILAGRDTTSSGLSWFFWLLSLHPNVVENIQSEIENLRARQGRQDDGDDALFDLDELREMNYLHAAISESLRLYPPVSVDTKTCDHDDVLPDGTLIKKDWFITYSAYAMGRMQAIWGKDCETFRPERWLENRVFRPESPFRYPVFHAGPRICPGKEMAFIQMKSIVACVVENFEVDVVGKEKRPGYILSLTLRMKGGLPVRVVERNR